MSEDFTYCAFISYSHRDEKWASWLHKALETYRVPKHLVGTETAYGEVTKRLGKVFRDREELPSSQDLGDELTQALKDSACLIVICSPNAAKSHWTNEEILTYKRLGREAKIFSLIVGGEPNASANPATVDQECFPPALRFRLGAGGNLSDALSEPIAADARPQGDGKQHAKLKLISGMLRVGFDALKQREQQRRQRRMLAITTASLAGMVLAVGLATFAMLQRNEAQAQRARAEAEAEIARETRDFMVGLFKVSDPSEALGNTITAREILDKGAARIENELGGQPAIQATLMETMGTVYTSLGLYPPATALLKSALAKKQLILSQNDPEIARSLAHYGEVLTLDAKFEKAETVYREALAISIERLGQESVETAGIKAQLAYLLMQTGKYQTAQPLFNDALKVQRRRLGGRSPAVAESLDGLAMNHFLQGDLERSVSLFQEVLTLRREIHNGPHPDLAAALSNLGLALRKGANYREAETFYREALEMKQYLFGDAHPEIALGLNNLAVVLRNQHKNAEAEELYRQAIDMQRQLLGDGHPDVALALNNIAFVRIDQGDLPGAISATRESLEIYRLSLGDEHALVARGMANLAIWLALIGDYDVAEALSRDSLGIRRKVLGHSHAEVASSLTILAYVLVDTGRAEEALGLASEAKAIYMAELPDSHWFTATAIGAEGAARAALGQYNQAEKLLLQSYEIISKDPRALSMIVNDNTRRLADFYAQWDRPVMAARYHEALRKQVASLHE